MRLRVVCDTNVLVSALIADGPPSRLVELAIDERIDLIVPGPVVSELERVLRGKLGFGDERWEDARGLLDQVALEQPVPPSRVESVTGDPNDDEILACAVEAAADVLVTGDRRHLLPVSAHGGVRIVTPQTLLAKLTRAPE